MTLPNGIFNFAIDTRYELQEIAGKPFERYEEIPSIQLVYDRLLTNTMNFFANVGDPYLESLSFLPGSETYRGIHLGSTRAELMAAYGEPEMDFEEHGVCRIEYSCSIPINQEETILSLSFVVNVKKDAVTSILIRRGY